MINLSVLSIMGVCLLSLTDYVIRGQRRFDKLTLISVVILRLWVV